MTDWPRTINLDSEEATTRLAEDLAMILKPGDVIALEGDLGAGKSAFARALIRAFVDDAALDVPSPTFTLVQPYEMGRFPLAHFDLYRLSDPEELIELGFDELLQDGAALIEWPSRAEEDLPDSALTLSLAMGETETSRIATLAGPGHWQVRFTRTGQARAFLTRAVGERAQRRHMQGDASARHYERINDLDNDRQLVLMDAPAAPDGPPLACGRPYSAIAHIATDIRPFVAMTDALATAGLTVPHIHGHDLAAGFLLLEDLGQDSVLLPDRAPVPARYKAAVEALAHLHQQPVKAALPLPDGTTYHVPSFDDAALHIEVDLLLDWYVPEVTGAPASADQRAAFTAIWGDLFAMLVPAEKHWVLRDVHSPNLIWQAGAQGLGRVAFIDYQDAMIGPSAYDVASLLQDARISVPEDLEKALLETYLTIRQDANPAFDPAAFRLHYAIMAVQRLTKVIGIFARLKNRDGKPHYMDHVPQLFRYLARDLQHESLHALKAWYQPLWPEGQEV